LKHEYNHSIDRNLMSIKDIINNYVAFAN